MKYLCTKRWRILFAFTFLMSMTALGGWSQQIELCFSGEMSDSDAHSLQDKLRQLPNSAHARLSPTDQRAFCIFDGPAPEKAELVQLLDQYNLTLECWWSRTESGSREQFERCREQFTQMLKANSFNTCATPISICDGDTLPVSPWGFGSVITFSPDPPRNPAYDNFSSPSPWINPWLGGTNWGCLQSGERHTIWLRIDVTGSGNLEWAFNFDNSTFSYMDWSIFSLTPATCTALSLNTPAAAPVRCNWNDLPEFPTASTGMATLSTSIPVLNEEDNYELSVPVLAGQSYMLLLDNWSGSTLTGVFDFSLSPSSALVCTTILPADHTELIATSLDQHVLLNWIDLDPNTYPEYAIERAGQDGKYKTIALMDQNEFKSRAEYQDKQPLSGQTSYRLRKTTIDGQHLYSNVVLVDRQERGFTIAPNPARGQQINFVLEHAAQQLHVYDLSGRLVWKMDQVPMGEFNLQHNLDAGVYLIEMLDENGRRYHQRLAIK